MNPETINLLERPYLEVVDDLLTALVGGVVNEPIFFDVKEDLYRLAQPARDVRAITGIRTLVIAGAPQTVRQSFLRGIDFEFSLGDNAVIWQAGGAHPDDETIFHVDYFRPAGLASSPLTDLNVGSVTRTLAEAIGREIATTYEQINAVYRSGFVDTAEGRSLDFVVAILGVVRRTKDYATGLVTFFRDPAAPDGSVTIPEGTLVTTGKGEAAFATTQPRTLQRGQVRIDAPIRATEVAKGEKGVVPAGAITTLSQPITGIAKITNFEATRLGTTDEGDAELRLRAKAALRGLGKATLLALRRVVGEAGVTLTEVWDPNSPPAYAAAPGTVTLVVETEPETLPSLRATVDETRAAGVLASIVARYVFFKPKLRVTVRPGLTGAGKVKVQTEIIAALQAVVDPLSSGQPVPGAALIAAAKGVADVQEARIVDVMAWRSDLGQPGASSLIDSVMGVIAANPGAEPSVLRDALTQALTANPPTAASGRRIPDRGLVQGPSGARATDAEIDAGTWQVSATVDGQAWWAVLDCEPADVVLNEA
jgi:hypothetical protein